MPVEKQSLKKNTVSILIARIAAPASSLFLIICVARYLGVEELGKYSLILSFLLLFQILPTFGLNYYITREVSRDNSLAGRYLVDGMLFFIISGLFFSVVLNILAHFLSYPDDVKTGLFIVSFALVPSGLYVLYESLLMGLETMSYLSTVNLLEGLFRSLIGISGVMAGFGFYWLVWTLFLSKCTEAKKLFSRFSRMLSFMETPGVTSSVIPRFTIFLVSFGSSSCSQMATLCPALTNFGK